MNRIRQIRAERAAIVPAAFSRTAVARRLVVADSTFRDWELGKARPRQRHAKALARELGVTVGELQLDGESPEEDGQSADDAQAHHGKDSPARGGDQQEAADGEQRKDPSGSRR